jgi:hypothetical protein
MRLPDDGACPVCGEDIIDGDDGDAGEHIGHVSGYNAAMADVAAWVEAMFPEAHSLIKRIKSGEPEGFRKRR